MPPQRGGRPLYPQPGQPTIYGAHGQPLGPMTHDPNYPPPPHGYPMPPPGPYPGAPVYDDRGPPQPPHTQDKVSLKRLRSDESFQPAPPPPAPPEEFSSHTPYQGHPPAPSGRRGSGGGYEYPDPTGLVPVSPASSATSFQSAPYPPQGQPYSYPPPQPQQQPQQPPAPRRSSPQSAYSYDATRASGSPHGSASSQSAGYTYPGGLHPPQVLPPRDQGRTPPPGQNREGNGNGSAQRGGMAVRDMLAPQGQAADSGGRSSADSDMLRALNKKGPN